MTNLEILNLYLDSGLIQKCLDMQFLKLNQPYKNQYKDDLFQDICVYIMNYDNDKLNDINDNNHMNAWLTRVIINQIYSSTSSFWHKYLQFNHRTIFNTDDLQIREEYEGNED